MKPSLTNFGLGTCTYILTNKRDVTLTNSGKFLPAQIKKLATPKTVQVSILNVF